MTKAAASVFIAERVEFGTQGSEVNGVRFFDSFTANGFPVNVNFWVLGKVWGIPGATQAEAVYRVVRAADGQIVAEAAPHRWRPASLQHVHTAISRFDDVQIPAEGTYEVQMVVGDSVVAYFPLRVVQADVSGADGPKH